jgi:hypothetical protein
MAPHHGVRHHAKELQESIQKALASRPRVICARANSWTLIAKSYVHELVATCIGVGDAAVVVEEDPPLLPSAENSGVSADSASISVI